MNGVKWIKLDTGIFQSPKIRKLRRMPSGSDVVIIYIDLLTIAGRQGGTGELMLTDSLPFDLEDLACECETDVNTMRMAMTMLQQLSMVRMRDDGCYVIEGWEDHQAVDGSVSKNRERQRRWRERQKSAKALPAATPEQDRNVTHNVTPNVSQDVTGDVTRDVAVDALEIREKSKEEEQKEKVQKEKAERDVTEVIDYLNERSGKRFSPKSKESRSLIRARLADGYTVEELKAVVDSKCAEWLGDDKWSKFVRPSTLFRPGHFDEYLANARAPAQAARSPDGQAIDFSVYD